MAFRNSSWFPCVSTARSWSMNGATLALVAPGRSRSASETRVAKRWASRNPGPAPVLALASAAATLAWSARCAWMGWWAATAGNAIPVPTVPARPRSTSRRPSPTPLDLPAFHLAHQVVAGAHAQRHDRQRRVLAGIGREARGVQDEEVGDVV